MLNVSARDEDPTFPITEDWRRAAMSALGDQRGAHAKLARSVGWSPGTLTELLKNGKRSHLVPAISRALGISPTTMIVSQDTHEVVAMLEKMGPQGRRLITKLAGSSKAEIDAFLTLFEMRDRTK